MTATDLISVVHYLRRAFLCTHYRAPEHVYIPWAAYGDVVKMLDNLHRWGVRPPGPARGLTLYGMTVHLQPHCALRVA